MLQDLNTQIEYNNWNTEIYQLAYEPCLENCQQYMKKNKIFSANELNCVYNCTKKVQMALHLLMPRINEVVDKGFV